MSPPPTRLVFAGCGRRSVSGAWPKRVRPFITRSRLPPSCSRFIAGWLARHYQDQLILLRGLPAAASWGNAKVLVVTLTDRPLTRRVVLAMIRTAGRLRGPAGVDLLPVDQLLHLVAGATPTSPRHTTAMDTRAYR